MSILLQFTLIAIGTKRHFAVVQQTVAIGGKADMAGRDQSVANDPSLTWTVLDCCSAPGSSSVGPSAVAICAVIGGNARKQGVGR